ncbi:MAG: DNA-binding response regulator [Actinobacteria bacterium ATB1]|nr:DNA-binding response regulator [Actinobacteria bacterium ATB1]
MCARIASVEGVKKPITVFLVDDHEIVREGVRSMLNAQEDIEVIGETSSAEDAPRRIRQSKPDVVILDVRMPDGSGVDVCRDIKSENPDLAVLMLTSFADDEALFNSIMAGASGFVLKQVRGNDLLNSIRTVAQGGSLLDQGVHDRVLRRLRGESNDPGEALLSSLTDRERRIVELIAEGKTNRQIADEIHLAEKTVKNYVSNILSKLGMARRSEAAAFAARLTSPKDEGPVGDPAPPNWP